MIYPTLYKRTSTGAVQVWHKELDGDKYRTTSGQIDGQKVTSSWTTAEPKNVGRANATDAETQARLEVEAIYREKLAQGGYHDTIEDIDSPKFFQPMLAKGYKTIKDFGVEMYSQPKLDGVRGIVDITGVTSRYGKPLIATPHITERLAAFFAANPDAILDGELYTERLSKNFDKIISLIKQKKPTVLQLAESADVVEYHVYDYPTAPGNFADRFEQLGLDLAAFGLLGDDSPIKLVETVRITDQDQLDELYSGYVANGQEGQIIRLNTPYLNKRTSNLLKRKEFIDEEYEVVDILSGKGNREDKGGRIVYRRKDGVTFKSGIKGSFEYATQLLIDKDTYIGGEGTVRYFNLTPAGIPRFPVTVALYGGKRDV